MGYRGDDASRAWANARRDGYGRYGGQHDYPGNGQPDGYDEDYHGAGPYRDADPYDDPAGYDDPDGYGGPYGGPAGYGDPGGYGGQGQGGFGSHDDYPGAANGNGYGLPAGGFPDNDWYGDSRAGGFADTRMHARPQIPEGYRPGDYDPGFQAPGGTQVPRTAPPLPRTTPPPGSMPPPGPPALRGPAPEPPEGSFTHDGGLTQTRHQRMLDDGQYAVGYPGYENVDDDGPYGATYPGYENIDDGPGSGGYPVQQGYDDYDDYADFTPDYAAPPPTVANRRPGYAVPAPTASNPAYAEPEPGYAEPDEFDDGPDYGYDDGFDDQPAGASREAGGQGASRRGIGGRAGRKSGSTRPGARQGALLGKAGKAGKAGKPRLPGVLGNATTRRKILIGGSALCLVVALAAVYVFLIKPSGKPGSTADAPLPKPGSTSAARAACVKKFGQYCHIEYRKDDPKPLTISELYPPVVSDPKTKASFQRIGTRSDKTCSDGVLGHSLIKELKSGKCTQVLRASYTSGKGSNEIMGTIGVANLETTNEAHYAGKVVGTSNLVHPLATSSGVGASMGQSTGMVHATFKGHYLIMTWAELADGPNSSSKPTQAQYQQIQRFATNLVAITANIALSHRMVTGKPGTGT
ncbi:MAG: hypothetical protein J2P25_21145 [Nocardiopsaceae bacterium]|nr:hypothetical protein [Nocardiopsaceae bacterium]